MVINLLCPTKNIGSLSLMTIRGKFYSIGNWMHVVKYPKSAPTIFGFNEIWHLVFIDTAIIHCHVNIFLFFLRKFNTKYYCVYMNVRACERT